VEVLEYKIRSALEWGNHSIYLAYCALDDHALESKVLEVLKSSPLCTLLRVLSLV
jgi:hypothetical protein